MLTVKFYTFSKRVNSTKRVNVDPVKTFQCTLKAPTSVKTPVLQLSMAKSETPYTWNYCFIEEFGRYYFVLDWSWNDGLWSIALESDLLATYKTQIGASTQYVLRASARSNGYIEDSYYPATLDRQYNAAGDTTPLWGVTFDQTLFPSGSYAVGVAGQTTAYLLMDSTAFNDFFDALFSDDYLETVTGAGSAVTHPEFKLEINPIQYIKSVVWFPFDVTGAGAAVTGLIKIGNGYIDASTIGGTLTSCGRNTMGHKRVTVDVSTLTHPQASRGEYLNRAPYTNYVAFVPGFGYIQIDSVAAREAGVVTFELYTDIPSGVTNLWIYAGTGRYPLGDAETQIGVPVQVSQVLSSGYGLASAANDLFSFMSSAGGAMNGSMSIANNTEPANVKKQTPMMLAPNLVGSSLKGIASIGASLNNAITNSMRGRVPTVSSVGSNGPGLATLRGFIFILAEYQILVNEDVEDLGRPLCEMVQISSIPGLIQCLHTDLALPTTADEIEVVKSMMDGGFFYE